MGELNNSRPVIEIELIRLGAGQSNKGASSKNSQFEPTIIGDAIWHFELHWDFHLIIRNNSSFPAYDIELLFKEGGFDYIDRINSKIPILPHTEKILSAKYKRSFEGKGSESNKLIASTLPNDIKQIRILSNYKGEDRKVLFRSAFTYSQFETPRQKNEIIQPSFFKRYIRQITIGSVTVLLITIATIVSGITDGLSLFDREKNNIDITAFKKDLNVQKIYGDSIYLYLIEQKITIKNDEKKDIFIKNENTDNANNTLAFEVDRDGIIGVSLFSHLMEHSLEIPTNKDIIYCTSIRYLKENNILNTNDSIRCRVDNARFYGGGKTFSGNNIIRPGESKDVYLYLIVNPWIRGRGNRARYFNIKAKIPSNRSELFFEHTFFIEGAGSTSRY